MVLHRGSWFLATLVAAAIAGGASVCTRGPVHQEQPRPEPVSEGTLYAEGFHDGVGGWQGVAGLSVETVAAQGRDGAGLLVHGSQPAAWRYAFGPTFDLTSGRAYRLSAWVLVQSLDIAQAPRLQVEFLDGRRGRPIGSADSPPYDLARGRWQQLSVEFVAPDRTLAGRVSFHKGGNSPATLEAYLDDVGVTEAGAFDAQAPPPSKRGPLEPGPRPPSEPAAQVHPRLHLSRETIASLAVKIRTEPYATFFRELKQAAEVGVKNEPPAEALSHKSGDEQNWQRDVGDMIPQLAMVYLLTDDETYLKAATRAMRASAGYASWGKGRSENLDLAAAHQLYGLALGYDWLYDRLDEPTRRLVRDRLRTRGQYMFEKLKAGEVWWSEKYLANHLWVKIAGLCTAGLALQGEVDGVDAWISLCVDKLRSSIAGFGPDGVSYEGVAYWSYGLEYLLKFMDLARARLQIDLFHESDWFRNTASYRLYSMLPRKSWTAEYTALNFGDGPPRDFDGPDFILRKLAAEYRDPYAQWLARELDDANLAGNKASFLNLLWYDPSVEPKSPAGLPNFKHFPDMNLVVMRSGWDGDEAVFAFRCGPHLGHHALARFSFDPGSGHLHPDAGSFLLFAQGEWLIGPEINVKKTTELENTVRVNGIGQTFEGGDWKKSVALFREKRGATVLLATPGERVDYVQGDARPAYPKEAGLKRFLRHVLYVKPSCWVLVDELETESPARFEWWFHSLLPFVRREPDAYVLSGPRGSLLLEVLAPPGIDGRPIRRQQVVSNKLSVEGLELSNSEKTDRITLVAVLYAHPSSSPPRLAATIRGSGAETTLHLDIDGRPIALALDLDREDLSQPILREVRP